MWETVRAWLINLTVITVLYTLADMLLPSGGIRKFARLVIGLMVMAAILTPLAQIFSMDLAASFKANGERMFPGADYEMDKTYKDSAWEVYSRQFENMNSTEENGD